jgi:MscS family membrane protein
LIDLATHGWLKRLAGRTESRLNDLLLELLRGPVKIVALALLLNIGLNVFDWPFKIKVYFTNALVLVVAGALTWLAVKVANLLLELWRARITAEADRMLDAQLFAVLRKSLSAAIIILAVLATAQNIGINVTAALASLSIGGLAVGLAAQDTLANLFGAMAVLADKPFRVGDTIKLDAAEGVVESIGLRSTRVRNADGHLVTIPNKTMGNAAITNISSRPNIRTAMTFSLNSTLPAAKIKRALAIMKEVYGGNPMTQDLQVNLHRFAGRRINIQVVHWWRGSDNAKYFSGLQEMNLTVKERLDEEGIE